MERFEAREGMLDAREEAVSRLVSAAVDGTGTGAGACTIVYICFCAFPSST